jgi:N,N-dimethylformamidase
MLRLIGYADRISVAPGEAIAFMVSSEAGPWRGRIVRLIHGDANPAGPGFKAEPAPGGDLGVRPGRRQELQSGSYVRVDDHPALSRLSSFTLAAMIWPTTPAKGWQAIIAKGLDEAGAGAVLGIDDQGCIALTLADGAGGLFIAATGRRLLPRRWYLAGASLDAATGKVRVFQRPLDRFPRIEDAGDSLAETTVRPAWTNAPLTIGAAVARIDGPRTVICRSYNGKIDGPKVLSRAAAPEEVERLFRPPVDARLARDVVADWDFAREIPTLRAVDAGPNRLDGTLVNLPARGMKGWRWTGSEMAWTRAPGEYGAIHFHDDDLGDAGWRADAEWTVPDGTRSGVYCCHLAAEDGSAEDYIPFCIRPPRGTATAKAAVLLPTAAYMAYANDHSFVDAEAAEMIMGRLIVLQPGDMHIDRHRELGMSLYDKHSDGSGVCYSSRLRPILNMRPKYSSWIGAVGSGLWQFNADTHLIDWLEATGTPCDVITDEDLHREGYGLLAPYRVVMTGTHPEYHSLAMWDAMRAYLDRGGRLMYLGANGWYWRIAWHGAMEGVIEVRRAEDGIRTWEAEPGEYVQSFDGALGGLWRRNGRPPQMLAGTGFTAQGFDTSSHYVRKEGSFDPRAAFIFEGVGAGERIGDFGLVGGGAAGLELDRAEPLLGTPPNALTLASSVGHSDLYLLVNEEFTVTVPDITGSQHPNVRADMVFFETRAGGAVFASSSIAWCGSLSHNGYDNNVSRITGNVLRRFLKEEPFA